ncbi:acylneuraminate cytidylyltransferase family protein [Chitinophaga polysaccharea]|uniref:acylneuraminate cytidylyltransferase family protein n=1 Tax=Chitinophaga polysaccharea TaxID=1293035 RepID=UPI0014557261|nr:acylneuraminate cytidylyltransferase family protein [Chitinophaga polysaccharea]NLR61854.1 acylneuraminate cytidylyltransferase family protein [Chitinophaga polysaccharea]
MNILITICARGGSKGIPGKNIRTMAGKPLIGYTIETARKFAKGRNCVISLSTDSEDIIAIAAAEGLPTSYRRPSELATDAAGKLPVLYDVLAYEEQTRQLEFDYIIDLDVTAPFRTDGDIKQAFDLLDANQEALNLFSVSPAHRNPYFNMVEENNTGFFELCKKGNFLTRQSAPKVYDLNASFYIYKKKFFKDKIPAVITDKSLVYVVPHMCFDLDHPIDFEFMEYLLINKKLDFLL